MKIMKIRLVIWILLLFWVVLGYAYFKELFILSVPFFKAKYLDMATIILVAIILTYILSKIIDIVLLKAFKKILKQDWLAKKLLPLLHNIIIILVWVFAIFTTIDLLGFNIAKLLTGAWIWWVIIALAGKEAASNLFGSLSLIFSKSFKPWDIIRIKWIEWVVEEITLSNTKLTDKKWNIVYIPNKNIIVESIENLSQWRHRKNEFIFPIPLSISSKDMKKLIKSLESYWDKAKKDLTIEEYKIMFDSIGTGVQNITFMYQSSSKSDNVKLKKNIYFDLKDILDEQNILLIAQ
ncbi:MAG: MscS mechanosensitive ion channel [uncultured bacterium (gcode 4)]|uniref:MscS mechanosensitive ion channel n=1 Tax=uncultured bacterium (gcode 4) TaxID=1234023 RepID=K2FB43_9BACT|nr:MAG: MscS mechanosensitive ion channel [uncultured bacterium (gcode 4)]